VAATVIVLAFAVTAGFVVAYLVASGRAVDAPSGLASPTPRHTAAPSRAPGTSPQPTGEQTNQPRRTPTPVPVVTPEATPFEHTIARGESLSYIAGLYCTTVDEIQVLNDIANPNRIQVGQVILIPGGGCTPPEASPG
jgi:LysM repeat protein